MRRVYTLIFVGCISCTGFTAHAQNISLYNPFAEVSFDSVMAEAMVSSGPVIQPGSSAIEAGESLVTTVEETEGTPVVAEALIGGDVLRGRYPPRLKIDFSELPLRSLATASKRGWESKTQRDIIVQRIQKRFSAPDIDFIVIDRTAILSGTVSTNRHRDVAASMLRLEPGIDVVQNEITVVSPLQDAPSERLEK